MKATRIPGISAVPPLTESGAPKVEPGAAQQLKDANLEREAGDFVREGWSFVEPSQAAGPGFGVYKLSDGRIGLVGKTLNVKFSPDTSSEEIEKVLADHNMRKRRQLGMIKNFVMAELDQGIEGDAFAYSARLTDNPKVEFAEPVVVEKLGHR